MQRNIIDFQLLGIGVNGHVGFNEPEQTFDAQPHMVTLAEETIDANSRFFQCRTQVPRKAITMGMRDIVSARKVVLMAFGEEKADAIRRLFSTSKVDPLLPCSIIKLCHDCAVVVDKELAAAAWPEGIEL